MGFWERIKSRLPFRKKEPPTIVSPRKEEVPAPTQKPTPISVKPSEVTAPSKISKDVVVITPTSKISGRGKVTRTVEPVKPIPTTEIKAKELFRTTQETKAAPKGSFSILAPFTEMGRTSAYIDQQVGKGIKKIGIKDRPAPTWLQPFSVGRIAPFLVASPLLATSTTGLQTIKATTAVRSFDTRTILGTKKGITATKTEGAAISKTTIEGMKVKQFTLAKTQSMELSRKTMGITKTISTGKAEVLVPKGTLITKPVVAEKYISLSKTLEKPSSQRMVRGISLIKTKLTGVGKLTTKGLTMKPVKGADITKGIYEVGSKPLSKTDLAVFRKTGFRQYGADVEGAGILKIQMKAPTTAWESFKGMLKGKAGQLTTVQQVQVPISQISRGQIIPKTSTTGATLSQIGIKPTSFTYTAGTYGLRPTSLITFGGAATQITRPVTAQRTIPIIRTASIQIPKTEIVQITKQTPITVVIQGRGQVTRLTSGTAQIVAPITKTTLVPITRTTPSMATPISPRFMPPIALPPFTITPRGFGFGLKKGPSLIKPQRVAYQPSLKAMIFGIKAYSIPKSFMTGITTRPIIYKKRKKK